MPAPSTVTDFLDVCRKSGVVDETHLSGISGQGTATPVAAAKALIRKGILTKFQASQLLTGKWKGFSIGGKYRLLRDGAVPNGLPPSAGVARTAVGFANGGRTMFLVATQAARPGARGRGGLALEHQSRECEGRQYQRRAREPPTVEWKHRRLA